MLYEMLARWFRSSHFTRPFPRFQHSEETACAPQVEAHRWSEVFRGWVGEDAADLAACFLRPVAAAGGESAAMLSQARRGEASDARSWFSAIDAGMRDGVERRDTFFLFTIQRSPAAEGGDPPRLGG